MPLDDAPAFAYDKTKTPLYLEQILQNPATSTTTELRRQLADVVDEVLDGPWLPLYTDYSAAEAGGVGPAEWCFIRPGEYMLALSEAAPYITDSRKEKARAYLQNLSKTCPPTRQVYMPGRDGKPRSIRKIPLFSRSGGNEAENQRNLFYEAYAIWAYAHAFAAWDDVRPLFDDLQKLRGQLETRGDFEPVYKTNHAGPLLPADLKDSEYCFRVYESMLAGFEDNYGYHGGRAARERMEKNKPVFFYIENLSALLGYYRLARHFGVQTEMAWVRQTFEQVAALTLEQKSAPFLWSNPSLCPEVARLIRDAAGGWLAELAKTSNVGILPATDWNRKIVPGKQDYSVMNPYTWYHAWGGQGEGVRPRTVFGAFLVNAWLFQAPADKVVQTMDIPWSKADLYYARKLVTTIQVLEKAHWIPLEDK